jgi:hypothetical protein
MTVSMVVIVADGVADVKEEQIRTESLQGGVVYCWSRRRIIL